MVEWVGMVTGAGNSIVNILWILLLLGVIGGLVFFIMNIIKYKHHLRIKKIANDGRKIVFNDKFREIIDKDGIRWWKLLKYKTLSFDNKGLIPIAPSEAIEIDRKGRMIVEAYALDTGEIIYAKDIVKGMPNDLTQEEKIAWLSKNKVVDAYQPLTTKQRLMFIKQIRKAEEKKKTDWKNNIVVVASLAALVILAIAVMVLYEDMGKPLLSMADKMKSYQQTDKEMLEIMKEIKYGIQRIEGSPEQEKPPE